MNSPTLRFFGTFGVFGEIVRIQVEYRMLRGTQGRAVRLYEPGLRYGTVGYCTVLYHCMYCTVPYRTVLYIYRTVNGHGYMVTFTVRYGTVLKT